MYHGRVGGRLLGSAAFDLAAVTIDQLRLSAEGRVYGELPVIHEKRFGAIAILQPRDGLVRHAVFYVFAGGVLF